METTTTIPPLTLSHAELGYLMHSLNVKSLLGLAPEALSGPILPKGRQSLLARRLIQARTEPDRDRILGGVLRYLLPVFDPRRALMVVRNRPCVGAQTLVLYAREGAYTLHTMPGDNQHRFVQLVSPGELLPALLEMFPIGTMAATPCNVLIAPNVWLQFKARIDAGRDADGLEILRKIKMEEAEKQALLSAVKNAVVSGSFALVSLRPGDDITVESMALLADRSSAWAITAPAGENSGYYRIRRSGDDFPQIIRRMTAWMQG